MRAADTTTMLNRRRTRRRCRRPPPMPPPYECPEYGGTLFYVRAYGPSVITGIVIDHGNSSCTLEVPFVDVGEYTLEVVVTFSVPMGYDEFPAAAAATDNDYDDDGGSTMSEPGYEGYMVSNFPLQILVVESNTASSSFLSSSSMAMAVATFVDDGRTAGRGTSSSSWCTLSTTLARRRQGRTFVASASHAGRNVGNIGRVSHGIEWGT